MNTYDILIRPLITEDGMAGATLLEPQYIFLVDKRSNKVQIARAVEEAFNVRVKNVNTLRQKGKMKRVRRSYGRTAEAKKAFVTLEKGQTIDIF